MGENDFKLKISGCKIFDVHLDVSGMIQEYCASRQNIQTIT